MRQGGIDRILCSLRKTLLTKYIIWGAALNQSQGSYSPGFINKKENLDCRRNWIVWRWWRWWRGAIFSTEHQDTDHDSYGNKQYATTDAENSRPICSCLIIDTENIGVEGVMIYEFCHTET